MNKRVSLVVLAHQSIADVLTSGSLQRDVHIYPKTQELEHVLSDALIIEIPEGKLNNVLYLKSCLKQDSFVFTLKGNPFYMKDPQVVTNFNLYHSPRV